MIPMISMLSVHAARLSSLDAQHMQMHTYMRGHVCGRMYAYTHVRIHNSTPVRVFACARVHAQCLDLNDKRMVSVKLLKNDKDCLDQGLGEVCTLA